MFIPANFQSADNLKCPNAKIVYTIPKKKQDKTHGQICAETHNQLKNH